MTRKEFGQSAEIVRRQIRTVTGECLAYALTRGEWEFTDYGNNSAVLISEGGEQAIVFAHAYSYSCYKTFIFDEDVDGVGVKSLQANSMKEVYGFLNG